MPRVRQNAARQQHASVGKADIIHQRKAVIAHRLLKRPEQIVRRRHQKGAVLLRVGLIAAPGRRGVRPGQAVKALDNGLHARAYRPEIKRRGKHQRIAPQNIRHKGGEIVFLHTGLAVAAGVAAQAAFDLSLEQGDLLHLVPSLLCSADKRVHQLGSVPPGPSTAHNNQYLLHIPLPFSL